MTRARAGVLIVLPVVLLAGLMMLTLLLAGRARDGAKPEAKPMAKRIYTREEFHKEFMGAKLDFVRAKLGAPDEISYEDYWEYRRRTKPDRPNRHDEKEHPDDVVRLWYRDDRVYSISP